MQNNITFKHFAGFFKKICVILCIALSAGTLSAQTISTSGGTNYNGDYSINNPGELFITFVVENTSAAAVALTDVSTQLAPYFGVTAGTSSVTRLYYSTTSLSGIMDLSTAAWTLAGSGTATVPAALAVTPVITGVNVIIPPAAQYRFAVLASKGLAFSVVPTPTPNVFSSGGINLKLGTAIVGGGAVGYAGVFPTAPAGNVGAFFGGSVTLTSTVPCSGTPAPGNTISTVATACPSVPFTLSPQNPTSGSGVTYQWQSSAAATGPWTDITPGGTNSTYSTTLTVPTYYRVNVTCGGNTTATTPVLVGVTPSTGCYCTAGATSTLYEKIANVKFGTIDNSSTSMAGYENFTGLTPVANFVKGSVNPITVTGNVDVYDFDQVSVWIDFNQNGNFTDPGEAVLATGQSAGPYTANITIPAGALSGNTRMRLRLFDGLFGGNTTPCGTSTYGQVEDYTINITPCIPLTFASQPTAATTTCGGTATFTVGTTGSLASVQWQYRTSPTGIWQPVLNGGGYSGATTTTLTVGNALDTYNGYQYRALITGICSGTDFSSTATLTVNKLAPVITPAAPTVCLGTLQALTLTNTLGNADLINESFNTVPSNWVIKNNSIPAGALSWYQGAPAVFPANTGAPEAYIAANYNAVTGNNTISDWLFTPAVSMKNGDVFSFYTRTGAPVLYADRLQVRLSTNGASTDVGATATSVGDFTTLLAEVNPSLTLAGYPTTWTKYTVTISGLSAPGTGRIGFRYFVTSGGPDGANSSYIGVDDVVYTSTGGAAQGIWTAAVAAASGTIFSDAAGTVPYVAGTPATTVYVRPDSTRVYNVTYSTLSPCTSALGAVTVTVNRPITGTSTVDNQTVCSGDNAVFTASAPTTGSPLRHQWQVSTNGGATWANVANGGVYSGATTTALTITGATAAVNSNRYRDSLYIPVCNSFALSTAGTLTVNPLPVIVVSASPSTALYPGQTTTLTAAVSPNAAADYTWYRNGVEVPGATAATLVVNIDNLGEYYAEVNDVNTCHSVSNTVTIRDSSNTTLFIYPSPTSGQFQVRYFTDLGTGMTAPGIVNIYDSKGSRILTRRYTVGNGYTRMDVDLSNFSKGIYMVELSDVNGNRIKTGRVVIH